MADQPAQPKRWVIIRQFEHAVERTEEEIAELTGHGLLVRDASGPQDRQNPPRPAVPQNQPPAGTVTALAAIATAPAGAKETK